ncbi:MAG: DUF1800 family protein [Dehalococcoidia bacterium]
MADEHLELTAHLLRRAGAGATREELEAAAAQPYAELVEDLLHPERAPDLDDDLLFRYFPALVNADTPHIWSGRWIWRMANTHRPLEEKMALFWHHVFATGWFKSEHTSTMVAQVQMLRENGLGNLRTILLQLSRDPAMIFWLDNCESHAAAPNENYGRELLELFSMGIGNYTETDVKMAGRAFTGWTFQQPIPLYPYGLYPAKFLYNAADHDDSEKTFLGHTGRLNGEDIIDIIVKQEATARFIARHLYNFFVADEPQVSAWSVMPPQDPAAIDALAGAFMASDGDMREVMRVLLNADWFKAARFKRVKCPAEFIAAVLKLSGAMREPEPALAGVGIQTQIMGQALFDAPSVEGWHTGKEWIDGGTLTDRVNFAVAQVRDPKKPGVQAIIRRLGANGSPVTPADFVRRALELAGPVQASADTRAVLQAAAEAGGDLRFDDEAATTESGQRVARMLSLIVAAPEYQFA